MINWIYNSALFLYALCILPKILWQRFVHGKYKESFKARLGLTLPSIPKMTQDLAFRLRESSRGSTITKGGSIERNTTPLCDRSNPGALTQPEGQILSHFGYIDTNSSKPLIWIHTVSMGETRAAIPFFRLLRERYPHMRIVISSTTETGHAEAKRSMPEAEAHFFLPFDFPWTVRKFLNHLKPTCLIFVEGDIWFNWLTEAKKRNTHLFLINGKISERSTKRFRLAHTFSKTLFSLFDLLCVQNATYAQRFLSLGVPSDRLTVTGNIKLDAPVKRMSSAELNHFKQELGITPHDRIIVIASTHEPEEQWLLSALDPVYAAFPELKVILIPRHPERFAHVADQLHKRHPLIYSQRSTTPDKEKKRVILIDAMGLVLSCTQCAQVAIVGGSFVSHVGGHNIFEPVLYNVPVLFGPHMHGQPDLVQLVLDAHCGKQITLPELPSLLIHWLDSPSALRPYQEACATLVSQVQGATERTFQCLSPYFSRGL